MINNSVGVGNISKIIWLSIRQAATKHVIFFLFYTILLVRYIHKADIDWRCSHKPEQNDGQKVPEWKPKDNKREYLEETSQKQSQRGRNKTETIRIAGLR